MKYNIAKLKNINEQYKNIGLTIDSLGLVLNEKDEKFLVMFFNNFNNGDYLITHVKKEHLEITNLVLPKNLSAELEVYIQNNAQIIANKTNFENAPFKECDYVELIVDKKTYSNFGIHKGDRGVVALNKSTKNKVLVDFGNETDDFDGFVSVDFKDIKKVENLI